MMSRLAPTLLLLTLAGCSVLITEHGDLNTQIDHWVAQQEYGKALAALEQIRKDHPDHARLMKRRDAIRLQAENYERDTIAQAAQLARLGQWKEALELYDLAQSRLPDSRPLREGRLQLEQQRAARRLALEQELLLARAEGTAQLLPLQTARAAVEPGSWRAQRRLRRLRKEAERLSTQLTRIGRAALERKDIDTARRSLTLALRLVPTAETHQAHQELQKYLVTPATKPAPKPVREEEQRELLQHYHRAFNSKNWDEAQRLLSQLEAQPSAPDDIAQLRRQLNIEITKAVEQNTKQGIMLYSNGKYEEALAAWRKAQLLAPDNERVRAHIERAERVLRKLQTLQDKRESE